MFNRPKHRAITLAGLLLLCANPGAFANDFQEASLLFKQGQHSQAMEKVNLYLSIKPEDAKARFLKGLIVTEQGNNAEAIKIFLALTKDYPALPEPYNNLAALYAAQGQYDQAKLALEMAIRTHPSYATAHENLGGIYAKLASQAYDRALQPDHSNTPTKTKLVMIQALFENSPRDKPIPVAKNTAISQPCQEPCQKFEVAATITAKPSKPAKPSAPKQEPVSAAGNSDEVLQAVKAWAAAWSSQDVNSYLSFYADDFNTPHGESLATWTAARKQRVSTPKSIQITISHAAVKFNDGNHATVKFRQFYRANHLKASGNKTLLMVKHGGNWLIQEERSR